MTVEVVRRALFVIALVLFLFVTGIGARFVFLVWRDHCLLGSTGRHRMDCGDARRGAFIITFAAGLTLGPSALLLMLPTWLEQRSGPKRDTWAPSIAALMCVLGCSVLLLGTTGPFWLCYVMGVFFLISAFVILSDCGNRP